MEPISPDTLQGANVLVVGGSGSLGCALVRHLLSTDKVRRVAALSRDPLRQEQRLGRLSKEDRRLSLLVGDIRDYQRMRWACRHVDIVIHAAALKHVSRGEYDPWEYIKVNVNGTVNVARAASMEGVPRALFVSTDKAVLPLNVYGMTKALAERFWVRWNSCGLPTTATSAVRYGNVFNSQGNVLEVWQRQHDAGEPLTVTDRSATRFAMTLRHGVGICMRALKYMKGGEVFMLPYLPAIQVDDLIHALYPGDETVEIGLQPGEKMHELLVSEAERSRLMELVEGVLFVLNPEAPDWNYQPWPQHAIPEWKLGPEYSSDRVGLLNTDDIQVFMDRMNKEG